MTDQTTPAVYRQRLTPTGYIGAAICIVAPMALGAAFSVRNPEPVLLALLFAVSVIGPILVLIGREHYAYKATEQAVARHYDPKPWLKDDDSPGNG
jgi:hypothetical protein